MNFELESALWRSILAPELLCWLSPTHYFFVRTTSLIFVDITTLYSSILCIVPSMLGTAFNEKMIKLSVVSV